MSGCTSKHTGGLVARTGLLAAGILAALPTLARADVLVVHPTGQGDFLNIQDAVDAASDGDTIVVRAFSFQWDFNQDVIIAGKGIRLLSDENPNDIDALSLTVRDTTPSQTVVVEGIEFKPDEPGAGAGITVENCAGPVRLIHCTAWGAAGSAGDASSGAAPVPGGPALLTGDAADVAMMGSLWGGTGAGFTDAVSQLGPSDGGAALVVRNASLSVFNIQITGGRGGDVLVPSTIPGGAGGHAIVNESGTLFLGAGARAGNGGNSFCGGPCVPGGPGGNGLQQDQATAVTAMRGAVFFPGNGGAGLGSPIDGKEQVILAGTTISWADLFPFVITTSPAAEGATVVLSVGNLVAGDDVFLMTSFDAGGTLLPDYQGPSLLGPLISPTLQSIGTAGGTPSPGLTATVPFLPPGIEDVTLFFQVVAFRRIEGFLLGGSTTLTLIDAGI